MSTTQITLSNGIAAEITVVQTIAEITGVPIPVGGSGSANLPDGNQIGQALRWLGTVWSPQFLQISDIEGLQDAIPSSLTDLDTIVTGTQLDSDHAKLLTIEENAKDDQTGLEIKTLYELQPDTNAFTDSEKITISNLKTVATTGNYDDLINIPNIPNTLVELDTTVTGEELNADHAKLFDIEDSATADQTGSEIKALYEAELNTNAFTDAEKINLSNQTGINTGDQDLSPYSLISDIIDNTTSTNIDKPLSANQGKVLKDLINLLEGSLIPNGSWDANTNTPELPGLASTGQFWIVSADGNTDIGGITDWKVNDWAVKTVLGWAKVDNTDKVFEVNGQTGIVNIGIPEIPNLETSLNNKLIRHDFSVNQITSSTYNATINDQYISINTSSNNVSVTLPNIDNLLVMVRHSDGSTGSNEASITNTINGIEGPWIIPKGGWIGLIYDGSWIQAFSTPGSRTTEIIEVFGGEY